jgi:short-subunit dehydrogenase
MSENNLKKTEVVVITGASAGIGRATALRFARAGASLALIARDPVRLEQAKSAVESLGGRAAIYSVDVSDWEKMEKTADAIEQELGPIDVWINDAMLSVFYPVKDMLASEYKRVTEVTYLGYVHGTLAALKYMRQRDRGRIIQVGSALAYRAIPLQSAYCAAKFAVRGFTDALRVELKHDKSRIQITMVQMPAVNTPQFGWVKSRLPNKPQPVPPIFQPEVAAEAVYHAAHTYRREYFVGFPTYKTIWGNKIAPWFADRKLEKMGYRAQQTSEPASPDRPDNLWSPVSGPFGAHGTFDDRSKSSSVVWPFTKHRAWVCIAVAILIVLAFTLESKKMPTLLTTSSNSHLK